MKKRFTKLISTLLVLVMLTEMLPVNLLGSWIQQASAAEPDPLAAETMAEAEQSGQLSVTSDTAEDTDTSEESMEAMEGEEATEEDAAVEDKTPGIDAPYAYDVNEHERINLNTGELVYEAVDYVLPGVNGLDLVIGRRYQSQNARLCDSENNIYDFGDQNRYDRVLGEGWSFMFSSMSGRKALLLSDGTVLKLQKRTSSSTSYSIIGYTETLDKNKYLIRNTTSGNDYTYTITYHDGKTETFDSDGRIIEIKDAFNNTISFTYEEIDGFQKITITDTLQRVVIISSRMDEDGKITTTVLLPNNQQLTYETKTENTTNETLDGTYRTLSSYKDILNNTETYEYSVANTLCSQYCGGLHDAVNLTGITHITGAKTIYTYEEYETWSAYSFQTCTKCRITSRQENVDGQVLNRKTYEYTVTDFSGYPEREATQYGVTVTDMNGVEEKYRFGPGGFLALALIKSIEIKEVRKNGKLLYTDYGGNGFIVDTSTTTYYDQQNQNKPYSTARKKIKRDSQGRVTLERYATSLPYGRSATLKVNLYDREIEIDGRTRTAHGYTTKLTDLSKISVTEILGNKEEVIQRRTFKDGELCSLTDYEYDTRGNLIREKRCTKLSANDPDYREFETTDYSYSYNTDGSYSMTVTQSGVMTANGTPAVGTPGQAAGTIVSVYHYDSQGRLVSVVDGNGGTTSYTYDALGNVIGVVYPGAANASTVQYARDYPNNTATVTDENGKKLKYTYTKLGLLQDTIAVEPDGETVTEHLLSRREYDNTSRLIRVTDYVYGSVTEYAYDDFGNVSSEIVKQGHTVLSHISYTYHQVVEDGKYLKNTKTIHGDANTPDIITTEYFDVYGNKAKTGRVIGNQEYIDTYKYNFQGTMTSVLRAADSAKGLPFTEKYEYNHNDQVTKVYNATYEKDINHQYITNEYDALGRLIKTIDYAETPTTYAYDTMGRLISQTITTGTNQSSTTKYEYDPAGNLIREWTPTNALGDAETWAETTYTYGSRQRLIGVSGDGMTTSYTYDGVGNLLSSTTGYNTTSYTYDRYGNVLTMTDPGYQTETYSYTALGKPLSKTDRKGVTTTYVYDAMGRLVSETAGTDYRQYTYTPTGQIATEENNWHRTSYTYDGAGRVVGAAETELLTASGNTGSLVYNKAYTYDANDNRTGFTLTKGDTTVQNVTYTYDTLNRLSTVKENGVTQATYTYDTNGNRASLTYANGVTETYTYNKANWITGVTNKKGSEVLSSFAYTYYAGGNQKSKTDHTGLVTGYTYDGMGRLTQETESSGLTLSYTYDSAGNRSSMAATGTENYNKTYAYDGNNCIGYVVKHNGITSESVSYAHDANGNMLSETVSGGAYTGYTYNNFNQLTSTTNSNGTYTYSYNPQGIRTGKQANLTAISYLLDGGNVVAEQYGGTVDSTYLRGTNLISRTRSHSKDYYLYNAHGDVVNLTDPSGTVTKTYAYDAFGNEKVKDIYDSNPFRYCGEYCDTETGKYYLRARYYDPINGRFTQPDTHWNTANMIYGDSPQKINERQDVLGTTLYSYRPQITSIMQSGNLYVYGLNNPVAYTDPTGKSATLILAAGIFIFGTLGGLAGGEIADATGATGWKKSLYVAAGTLIGSVGGYALAAAAVPTTIVTAGVGASVSASASISTSVAAAGPVGSLGTTLLGSWQSAENFVRQTYGAVKHTFYDLAAGMSNRVVDGYNASTGIIYEVKYGYAALSQFIQTEVQRDAYLLQQGKVNAVEWHFFISQVTGKGGPSTPLLEALLEAGIKVVFH